MTQSTSASSPGVLISPSRKLTAKDKFAAIGVGLLLGGSAFFLIDIPPADAAPSLPPDNLVSPVDYLSATVDDIAIETPTSYDESESVYSPELDNSPAEPTDWFSALAAYNRNWACTIVSSLPAFNVQHEEYTIIGITLEEMEALIAQRNLTFRGSLFDESVICYNSENEIVEFWAQQ